MNEPTPTRPWWRKRRWRLALTLWLVLPLLYPASFGPVVYARARGWWSPPRWLYEPLRWTMRLDGSGRTQRFFLEYERAAGGLAVRQHRAEEERYWREVIAPDQTINRTHWTPPNDAGDRINRKTWTPPDER